MIVRIVKLSVIPERIDEFNQHFEKVKFQIRRSKGCSHLEVLKDINNDAVFFTYSIWDKPQSLQNYLDSPLFKSVWQNVKPLFSAKAEAWSLKNLQNVSDQL